MGGGGSTTTSGIIPPELKPLYQGSANALLGQQKANPLGQYNEANPLDVEGANPLQTYGASLIGGGANPTGLDALSLQSIMRGPGLAGAGPTTGRYDYGAEAGLGDLIETMRPQQLDFEGASSPRPVSSGYTNQEPNSAPSADMSLGSLLNKSGPTTAPGVKVPPPGVGAGGPSLGSIPGMSSHSSQVYAKNLAAGKIDPNAPMGPADSSAWLSRPGDEAGAHAFDARMAASAGQGHAIEGSPGSVGVNFASAGHGAPAMIVGPGGEISYPKNTDQGYIKGSMTPGAAPTAAPKSAAPPTPAAKPTRVVQRKK